MIDTLLNLMFRCPHRRLTRPVTPVGKVGVPHGETYVVCLDCGKQFSYDLKEMRIGKPLHSSHDSGVLPPNMPKPRRSKMKYAFLASLPLGILIGSALGSKRSGPRKNPDPPKEPKSPPDEHLH
jgi:hypothetical protein